MELPLTARQRARFLARTRRLPSRELTETDLKSPQFLIDSNGPLAVYWCPADPPVRVSRRTQVILVGVTPGGEQARLALQVARNALHSNRTVSYSDVCRRANRGAAFSGMRDQIVEWLDDLGIQERLGIPSCSSLFKEESELLAVTSAVRYAVFVHGKNYNGYVGGRVTQPFLLRYIDTLLSDAVRRVPNALIVPLGKVAEKAVSHLGECPDFDADRVLAGFPHPSPANGWRFRLWDENQASLHAQVNRWFRNKAARGHRR
jgi:hypothetical protein